MDDDLILTEQEISLDGHDLSDMEITIHDVMSAGHCVRGAKRWFEGYDLDFKRFLEQGISARDFLRTRDGHAIGIVRHKLREMQHG